MTVHWQQTPGRGELPEIGQASVVLDEQEFRHVGLRAPGSERRTNRMAAAVFELLRWWEPHSCNAGEVGQALTDEYCRCRPSQRHVPNGRFVTPFVTQGD